MQKINLHFNTFHLGELSFDSEYYTFKLDEESTKLLLKAGVNIVMFEANKKEIKTKELPLAFKNFLPNTKEKEDLLEKFGVLKTDTEFEKLVKISKLKLSREKFWLE